MENYSQLKTDVKQWLSSSDLSDSEVDNFIAIATARINRRLRIGGMETSADLTLDAKEVSLPSDFRGIRSIYIDSDTDYDLRYVTPEVMDSIQVNSAGIPCHYTIRNATLVLDRTPDTSYTAKLHYFQKFTAIDSDTTTNWLTDEAPDVLLWACCMAGALYNRDDDQIARFKGLWDEAMEELEEQEIDKLGVAPVARMEMDTP